MMDSRRSDRHEDWRDVPVETASQHLAGWIGLNDCDRIIVLVPLLERLLLLFHGIHCCPDVEIAHHQLGFHCIRMDEDLSAGRRSRRGLVTCQRVHHHKRLAADGLLVVNIWRGRPSVGCVARQHRIVAVVVGDDGVRSATPGSVTWRPAGARQDGRGGIQFSNGQWRPVEKINSLNGSLFKWIINICIRITANQAWLCVI